MSEKNKLNDEELDKVTGGGFRINSKQLNIGVASVNVITGIAQSTPTTVGSVVPIPEADDNDKQ